MSEPAAAIDYRNIFNCTAAAMLIIDKDAPVYTILDVNDAYLSATNSNRETLVGRPVFAAFPANPTDEVSKNIERTIYSFQQAITTAKPHTMRNYRYDIPVRGTGEFEERYWTTVNTPILDEYGQVKYFIHSPENVTEMYKLAERERAGIEALKNQRKQLYSIFMQAPVGIGIFRGPQYVVELINPPLCKLYGKSIEEMIGRPVFEVLHHARGLGFEELLDKVRLTGEPFYGHGLAVPLVRNSELETVYVNFVYEPYYEDDGSISGVIGVATEVTDHVTAMHKLEEAEERARLIADAVDLGTFDRDISTGETVTSLLFAKIFGFPSQVSSGEYIERIHPEDRELRLEAHKNALETGVLSYEARVVFPDHTIHRVRIEGKVYYKNDQPVRLLGTGQDITERNKAREDQQKLLTLVSNSVDLMSVLNLDGTNSYINQAGRNLLGFEREEQVLNTPISALHSPEDFEKVRTEVLPSVMSTGKWAGEMTVKNLKTGETFPVFNNCFRIDDPITGKVMGVGAVMRDLRPELAAKQALENSEQLFRGITTAAPTGLWKSDVRGQVNYVNQTWLDWTGRDYHSQLGLGWTNAIVPEDRHKTAEKFLADLEKRTLFNTEFRFKDLKGLIRWAALSGRPQYDGKGIFSGYIGAVVDITELKHLQQQKDDFIGIASHELKTPVTSIKAYAQLLQRKLVKSGLTKDAELMKKMDGQINRLTSLIGDLLDVTKINTGKLQFNDRDFDFDELVSELIEELQLTSPSHTLLAKLSPTGIVYADRERIGQVITNLVTNAVKYSPQADKVIITSKVENSQAILCVQDFGIGISAADTEKIFEQFYRVSGNMQHTFSGLGLGLYICWEIISRQGGRIWVSSREGEGATFSFSIPINQ